MVEVLPIKVLTDEDAQIFGNLNVALGKLYRAGLPVANGLVVTPPNLKLRTVLEHFDFGSKEIFEASLTLVKREINATPVPEIIHKQLTKERKFLVDGKVIESIKGVWLTLLHNWIDEIKTRLWNKGFYPGITDGLEPQVVTFVKKVAAQGWAYFDPLQDDTVIKKQGQIHPNDLKNLDEAVIVANRKLFIPHEYEWIVDGSLKLVRVKPFTAIIPSGAKLEINSEDSIIKPLEDKKKSTVKVFLDQSAGLVIERQADGVYISSEKIFDLNKPRDSFEDMLVRLAESVTAFPHSPILFKLADKSEGMGRVRGSLRLLHQKTLFDPLVEALDFIRHKKGLNNVHIVVPFVRDVQEFLQMKRELAVKKLARKNSLQLWLELAVPENLINLEDYLVAGLDGVILNLDELAAFVNGFDPKEQEVAFYKNNVEGLVKFLEDGIRLLHKSKIPFIALGSLSLNQKMLEFLIEKGVWGIVVERYEAAAVHDLLREAEKRMILRRAI